MTAKACNNKGMFFDKKSKRCRSYEISDFKIIHSSKMTFPDKRIPFILESKDGNIQANFFWEPNNVELRALYGEHGTVNIAYPFANWRGGGVLSDVKPEKIILSLLRQLKEEREHQQRLKEIK